MAKCKTYVFCPDCGALHSVANTRWKRCERCRFLQFVRIPEDREACWEWTGALLQSGGYGAITWRGSTQRAHRVSFEIHIGPIEDGALLDHICRNRRCVNPEHLRLADYSQNQQNKAGARVDSRIGYRGVSQSSPHRWLARVNHRGVKYHSYHDTPEAAADWARDKRNELYTHNDADRVIQ